MASWYDVSDAAPQFARTVQAVFDSHRHKVLGTLRKDGSPRLSGIETRFTDGHLWLGMMWQSTKALDLRRDPRFAVHTCSGDTPDDPTEWPGDAKISGYVVEINDPAVIAAVLQDAEGEPPAGPSHLFRAEITEVVVTRIGDGADHLVIESWHEDGGLRLVRRE